MILKKILERYKLFCHTKNVKKNALIEGANHVFSSLSDVFLNDGAKKENVVIKDNVWLLGSICVQNRGVVIMHDFSKIGIRSMIMCVDRVEIGAYTAIADNTIICDNNNHPVSPSYRKRMRQTSFDDPMRTWKYSDHAPIVIGENCWIGTNVRICKGVTIGNNSIVAACSVVTKDVPANCIVAGNPAKIVKIDIDKIPEPQY